MLGIVGAAEEFGADNEVFRLGHLVQVKITLRLGVEHRATVVIAVVGRAYFGTASIVSHAPVMNGAKRLNVVASLF